MAGRRRGVTGIEPLIVGDRRTVDARRRGGDSRRERSSSRDPDVVIDLRRPDAASDRYLGVSPPSAYGYDPILPQSWRAGGPRTHVPQRRETPSSTTRGSLPRRFRLLRRFPPLQRVVHHGPVDGADVEVKLTVDRSITLHSTGIEHPLRNLDGRLCDAHHLRLLIEAFGTDRRSLGTTVRHAPPTLDIAKRQWHKWIAARARHGFAIDGDDLVILEYLSPERDPRRRDFGVAYKRIVVAYEIDVVAE